MAGETRPLQSEDKGRVPRSQMLGQQEKRMPVLEVLTAFASRITPWLSRSDPCGAGLTRGTRGEHATARPLSSEGRKELATASSTFSRRLGAICTSI